MLLLTRADVESLLEPEALIDAVATAHAELTRGGVSMPARVAAAVPGRDAFLAAMPAHVPSLHALTTKLVTLFPHNSWPHPTHQALVAAFDPDTGTPAAIMDGTAITAQRTAAASALSARLLASPNAHVLAIVGTGVQARSHAAFIRCVRDIREIRVAGRTPAHVQALAAEIGAAACASVREALDGADIVCTTTHAAEPVIRRAWLTPGVHVTAVGYNMSGSEIDDDTLRDARLVVESRATALVDAPAGPPDLVSAVRRGIITADRIQADLGEVLLGMRAVRTSDDDITLYRSAGVAAQDAAAAAVVLTLARERGVGTTVQI